MRMVSKDWKVYPNYTIRKNFGVETISLAESQRALSVF